MSLDRMRESSEVYFVKTHRQRSDPVVSECDKAICLVRDGRDCIVSWARLQCEEFASSPAYETKFAEVVRLIITRQSGGTANWGHNVLSWYESASPEPLWVRFEHLINKPLASVRKVVAATVAHLEPTNGVEIPSFKELHNFDSGFFRRGTVGTHRTELAEELQDLFWEQALNVAAMGLFGYERQVASS